MTGGHINSTNTNSDVLQMKSRVSGEAFPSEGGCHWIDMFALLP